MRRDWVIIAAIAAGVLFLIKRGRDQVEKAINSVTQPLAETLVDLSYDRPRALGMVALPDGQKVSVAQIVDAGSTITGDGRFSWNRQLYQIQGRNAQDEYVAINFVT